MILKLIYFAFIICCQTFSIPTKLLDNPQNITGGSWKLFKSRPNIASMSCFLMQNGKWACIEDTFIKNPDPDDSY